ncbi:MAG: GspE/PulE family protein, partial [Actinomycetes bacterium]
MLLRDGILTPQQLAEAVVQQVQSGKRLGELLINLGLVDESQMISTLAEQLGMPLADLARTMPDPEVAGLLGETLARGLNAIPLRRDPDGVIVVAVSDPTPKIEDELAEALKSPVRIELGTGQQVRWAIDNTYRALQGIDLQVEAFTAIHGKRQAQSATASAIDDMSDDAPVTRVVNMIIAQALRDRTSDIHIEPQDERVRVRFRIDGALHDVLWLPASMGSAIVSRIKIMANMNIVERRRPQDGQIAMTVEGRALDIRVSTTGVIWGEKVVMRLLDKSRPQYRLNDLGFSVETHAAMSKLLLSPYGMLLCAGPTGSGKTTTLYASMNEVNSPERNITTIEDPVEYVFPMINQIQINEAAGVTFAAGLRSILRQDPDMILVGEIRDLETARIAVQSALTGHFVMSSVHATDAVSSLYRFLDMGIEPFLIASSVLGIVGQRLLRRTCQHCKEPYVPTADEMDFFLQSGGAEGKRDFWMGVGCNYCSQTGYSERIGVYELLTVGPSMRALLVTEGTTQSEIRDLAIAEGMKPLRSQGVLLVEQNITT